MEYTKTVCNSDQCCQVRVDENGIETTLSCTGSQWPTYKLD